MTLLVLLESLLLVKSNVTTTKNAMIQPTVAVLITACTQVGAYMDTKLLMITAITTMSASAHAAQKISAATSFIATNSVHKILIVIVHPNSVAAFQNALTTSCV